MSETLEQTVARLAALEDIRRLKAEYCLHCDRGYAPDALAELFTEDAVWDGGLRGRFSGRAAIREFFAKASDVFPYAAHLVMNPIINIDGDRATGIWRMMMPCTINTANGAECTIQVSEYNETYRREDGRWRIAELEVRRHRAVFPNSAWSAS